MIVIVIGCPPAMLRFLDRGVTLYDRMTPYETGRPRSGRCEEHEMHAHMEPVIDRRTRRSSHPLRALGYQLDDVARLRGLDALVLADRDGLFIAGGGRGADHVHHDAVASMCPLVVRQGGNCFDGRLDVPDDRELSVLMFSYRGQTLYLAALRSDAEESASDAMLGAMEGVIRILG
jgi:hypothetical protein